MLIQNAQRVKKASKCLALNNIKYKLIDIVKEPPPPLKKFFRISFNSIFIKEKKYLIREV